MSIVNDHKSRCKWCLSSQIYMDYHDQEWGVPERDSLSLFRKLLLDGAQAGLSWITILKKMDGYFDAFDQLDPERMSQYDEDKVEELMQDSRIIRNRLKINAFIHNSKVYLEMKSRGIDFSDFLWRYVAYQPIQNAYTSTAQVPAETDLSKQISKDLKKLGFKFVGPTIVYAFMQAVGMVNDHMVDCYRYETLHKPKT